MSNQPPQGPPEGWEPGPLGEGADHPTEPLPTARPPKPDTNNGDDRSTASRTGNIVGQGIVVVVALFIGLGVVALMARCSAMTHHRSRRNHA